MLAITLLLALQQAPVAHIVVTPANPTVTVGERLKLTGEGRDAAGRVVPGTRIRFLAGSFEGTVDSTGVVTGGSPGTLVVYAVALVEGVPPGEPTRVNVRILPAPAARIALTPGSARLAVGQRLGVSAAVYAANGDVRDDTVIWTSSAPRVVEIGPDGRLHARAAGTATVTATAGQAQSTIDVSVVNEAIRTVEVIGAGEARTGDVLRLRAVPRDAAGREIAGLTPTWTFTPGHGLVDGDGAFVAYEPGTYTVMAAFGNAIGEATVHARPRAVRRAHTIVGRLPITGLGTAEFWPHPNARNAYLSTMGDRVYALDISDPAHVTITDSVMVDARHINDVMTTADGRHAVITRENASSRRNGIVILSLDDPAHPKVLSEYTETVTGGVHSTFVYTQPRHGTHVFLTDDATGSMRVIDLNDPANPREIARWETARPAGRVLHDIDIRDGLAYLSYWNDGLIVLDVGNGMKGGSPAAPQLVSQLTYDLEALYRDVEAEGGPGYIRGTHTAWRHEDYVFVGDEVFSARPIGITMPGVGLGKANGRLHVVDVSDIENPRIVAHYEPRDGGVHNVWVAGDTLYVGDYQGGLRVIDISGELRGDLLAQGREIAHVHTGDAAGFVPNAAMAWGAFYHNGLIWVNDVFSGLWVVRLEPKESRVILP